MSVMSFKTTIPMFVTCMAPFFLVYFVVDGIHRLQLNKTTYVSENPDLNAHAEFESYIALCVACVVAWAVLSIYIATFGGGKRGEEENANQKAVAEDVRQRDEGDIEWLDFNLLKDDVDVDVVGDEAKRFHLFDIDDGISNVSLETDSSDDDVQDGSRESVGRLGWCVLI
ncbi:hypothetical protein BKA58DRAFT_185682 [Alternaria rosae]|uniref:uncharacterized protein n=1 Tax=Alternaria rosae TaxID=1187941 RepID=UPI001E8D602E|nr:uncharacterized protein BKA58DRAFT_185682 [Alternaria rosae]KAH6867934.1 hypothetical protein BKA58DRAFT_185682 [Alternaria rosae]